MAEENLKWMPLLKHHTIQIDRLNTKMVEAVRERQAIRDDLAVLKQGQDQLKQGQDQLRHGQDELKRGQIDLLGRVYERQIRTRANAVFGRFVRHGRKMRNKIGDYLDEAEEKGQLSDPEHEQVLACDLLWGGELRKSRQELFVAVRVSWAPQESDLQQAAKAAHILRSIGLNAVGVVAGVEWTDRLRRQALDFGVVIVNDLLLDKYSWQAALGMLRRE